MVRQILSILILIILNSCTAAKQYLVVDSANYQPAVLDESSRLTTVEVFVSNINSNVEFTSLVFRNIRVPVSSEELPGGIVKVTGFIQIGGKLVEGHFQKMTEESNRLYFLADKRQRYIPLENIQRQSTQIP